MTNDRLAQELAKLIGKKHIRTISVPSAAAQRSAQRVEELMALPLEELKAFWDRYSGDPDDCPDGYWGEEIHLALNRRGCGDYCAV